MKKLIKTTKDGWENIRIKCENLKMLAACNTADEMEELLNTATKNMLVDIAFSTIEGFSKKGFLRNTKTELIFLIVRNFVNKGSHTDRNLLGERQIIDLKNKYSF